MSFRVEERAPGRKPLLVGDGLDHDTAYNLVSKSHDDASPAYMVMWPSTATVPVMFRDLPGADIRPAVSR